MSEFEVAEDTTYNNQIRAIKFKRISEDDLQQQQRQEEEQLPSSNNQIKQDQHENRKKKKNKKKTMNTINEVENNYNNDNFEEELKKDINDYNNNNDNKRRKILSNNFSLEYTYPAVIFDRISFSVDKSQQQSNFLNEILYKISNCFTLSSSSSSHKELNHNKVEILKSVNLNVPYGSIFGLLGPSSCGKTTLLRCLVGLLEPSAGSIGLFGHNSQVLGSNKNNNDCCLSKLINLFQCGFCCDTSSSKQDCDSIKELRSRCKVPGSNVGYMPQDLGLYDDFSISQLLRMFGRYMGMKNDLIEKRIIFMASFLDLPDVDRIICSLSGGQKRRVSFAVACLHMPPLIILDEPTVGVDPLLRQSIWKYLRRLADEENKTIIITTHYIEEAAQADQVAFMRAGEILVQDSPKKIMQLNGSKTLEEAFLKICNNVKLNSEQKHNQQHLKLYPQPAFNWHDKLNSTTTAIDEEAVDVNYHQHNNLENKRKSDEVVKELKQRAQEKLALFDLLYSEKNAQQFIETKTTTEDNLLTRKSIEKDKSPIRASITKPSANTIRENSDDKPYKSIKNDILFKKQKQKLQMEFKSRSCINNNQLVSSKYCKKDNYNEHYNNSTNWMHSCEKFFKLLYALVYKNYKRNMNSVPLVAFQFLLPVIQMVSFSLCVGGRPTNIGLGLVNNDQLPPLEKFSSLINTNQLLNAVTNATTGNLSLNNNDTTFDSGGGSNLTTSINSDDYEAGYSDELLSDTYLSFIDTSMISIKNYKNLNEALADVRGSKLWAAMEIGENFTETILKRFDLDNFYQLDSSTIQQSIIRLYPDRSNKVLDMICQRSLINSYRQFLLSQFSHFRRLPIEVKEPIFDIKPNLISNSIDGYTESIAAGLLASLTYIMAAGLTTFIMVVERSEGILERTYTSGINPVTYLLAHALFRSIVMMFQIAVVMILTFYILKQPLVGSIWLAYFILMILNLTGISYGLLISSIVKDQNGAALTIVSSLVVKITMSGILWPMEAIPRWLRTICYIQPLTMPIQALKGITLKGSGIDDRVVYLGFLVSIVYLILFLTIAAKRFKFYQH